MKKLDKISTGARVRCTETNNPYYSKIGEVKKCSLEYCNVLFDEYPCVVPTKYEDLELHENQQTNKPAHTFKVGDKVKIPKQKSTGVAYTHKGLSSWFIDVMSVGYAIVKNNYRPGDPEALIILKSTANSISNPEFRASDLEPYDQEEEKRILVGSDDIKYDPVTFEQKIDSNGKDVIDIGDEVKIISGMYFSNIGFITQIDEQSDPTVEINIGVTGVLNTPILVGARLSMVKLLNKAKAPFYRLNKGDEVKTLVHGSTNISEHIARGSYGCIDDRFESINPKGPKAAVYSVRFKEPHSPVKYATYLQIELELVSQSNQSKTNHHESNKNTSKSESLLSSIDRSQVTERRVERGVGLKSIGIKGKLGSNNRYH